MSVRRLFEQVLAMDTFACPREPSDTYEELERDFGQRFVGEAPDAWLLKAYHLASPPATARQIRAAEEQLDCPIPEQYKAFLSVSNGARLFIIPNVWTEPASFDGHFTYWLFGTEELVHWNRWLLQQVRECRDLLGNDPEFDVFRLNYLAFCDVRDGNFNAFLVDPPHPEIIFFLHHDYCFCPYSEENTDLYFTVASSFEEWLQQLIDGGGHGEGRLSRGLWEAP